MVRCKQQGSFQELLEFVQDMLFGFDGLRNSMFERGPDDSLMWATILVQKGIVTKCMMCEQA